MSLSKEILKLTEADRYPGKLGVNLTAKLGSVPVTYKFNKLDGIPEDGKLIMDLEFKISSDKYHYIYDGRFDKTTVNGEESSADEEVKGVNGQSIELVASAIFTFYVVECFPEEVATSYLDLTGGLVIKRGDLWGT